MNRPGHPPVSACNDRTNSERLSFPLVMACDEAYAMQLATTLRSIVEANRNVHLEVYVLSDGFSENARRKVVHSLPDRSVSIHWVTVDLKLFAEFATSPHISKMTYARLLIPSILKDDVSRVLYLDSDILVLDDLRLLWDVDLEGAVIGGVIDQLDAKIKGGEPVPKEMPRVRDYFNAGVLLIDIDRWRQEQISERALQYLIKYPHTPYSDQDALNVACDGMWKKLNGRWNFQNHCVTNFSQMAPEQRPAIIHFVTNQKPWNTRSCSVNASFYNTFRNGTCFARTPFEIVLDTITDGWYRLRRSLRNCSVMRVIWNMITRRKVSKLYLP